MAEYIEREAAIGVIEQKQKELMPAGLNRREYLYGSDREAYDALQEISDSLEAIPPADVAPVVHCHWIMRGGYARCSGCEEKAKWDCSGGTGGWSHEYGQAKTPFCPHCGAVMDEEERK